MLVPCWHGFPDGTRSEGRDGSAFPLHGFQVQSIRIWNSMLHQSSVPVNWTRGIPGHGMSTMCTFFSFCMGTGHALHYVITWNCQIQWDCTGSQQVDVLSCFCTVDCGGRPRWAQKK